MKDRLIDNLPGDIFVEMPGIINKNGVHGVRLGKLLNNQYAVHGLTRRGNHRHHADHAGQVFELP